MPVSYEPLGPYEVPTYAGKAAKILDTERIREFWFSTKGIATRRGCYVFAVRAAKGYRPIYVGKATRNFQQEVFAPHKVANYQRCLADLRAGTPVLFFIVAPSAKGKPNLTAIGDLEDFLIQAGVSRNPELLNVRGTKKQGWAIRGVIRGGQGKSTQHAREFKRVMGL